MKALSLFIKQRDLVIKKKEYKLRQVFDRIDALLKEVESLNRIYDRLKFDMQRGRTVAEIFEKNIYCHYVLEEIKKKEEERSSLLKEAENLKRELAVLHGEKKAVEKFIMKLERERRKEELIQEGRLADEIFSRRFSDSSFND